MAQNTKGLPSCENGGVLCAAMHRNSDTSDAASTVDNRRWRRALRTRPAGANAADTASNVSSASTAPTLNRPHVMSNRLRDYSVFTQQLHRLWSANAMAGSPTRQFMTLITYCVDHSHMEPHCESARMVRLGPDFSLWEEVIKARWSHRLEDEAPVSFHIVQPTPVFLEPDVTAHVILIQNGVDDLATSLISVLIDNGRLSGRAAYTTLNVFCAYNILQNMDYLRHCHGTEATHICRMWYQLDPIALSTLLRGSNGLSLTLQLQLKSSSHESSHSPTPQR